MGRTAELRLKLPNSNSRANTDRCSTLLSDLSVPQDRPESSLEQRSRDGQFCTQFCSSAVEASHGCAERSESDPLRFECPGVPHDRARQPRRKKPRGCALAGARSMLCCALPVTVRALQLRRWARCTLGRACVILSLMLLLCFGSCASRASAAQAVRRTCAVDLLGSVVSISPGP